MIIKDISIRLRDNCELNISTEDIAYWDFDYNNDIMRIDLKDDSFYEIYKRNVLWVRCGAERNKE